MKTAKLKHILIVEDDALIALDLEQEMLRLGDVHVAVAHHVAAALQFLNSQSFDLALLDVNLGTENSFPIARRLARQRTPYVFLSGYGEDVRDLTADGFIQKPHNVKKLITMVTHLLGRDFGALSSPPER